MKCDKDKYVILVDILNPFDVINVRQQFVDFLFC